MIQNNLGVGLLAARGNIYTSIGLCSMLVGAALFIIGLQRVSKTRALVGSVVSLKGRVTKISFESLAPSRPMSTRQLRTVEVILPDGTVRSMVEEISFGASSTSIGGEVPVLYDVDQDLLKFPILDSDARRREGLKLAMSGLVVMAIGAACFAAFILIPETRQT